MMLKVGDVSQVLIPDHSGRPHAARWMHHPRTRSCRRSVLAKPNVRRLHRGLRGRTLLGGLALCWGGSWPTCDGSAARGRASAPPPSGAHLGRPNGAHRCGRGRTPSACRRPPPDAPPWPVCGSRACHRQRGGAWRGPARPRASRAAGSPRRRSRASARQPSPSPGAGGRTGPRGSCTGGSAGAWCCLPAGPGGAGRAPPGRGPASHGPAGPSRRAALRLPALALATAPPAGTSAPPSVWRGTGPVAGLTGAGHGARWRSQDREDRARAGAA